MTVEEQYKRLPKLIEIEKVPVLRPDKKYARDYKAPEPAPLAVMVLDEIEMGDNMGIVDAHVHVLPVLVK
jgi:hypothetical protein